jgi:regulator of protease activity HflC (stomatin/prohibitin superfamily)
MPSSDLLIPVISGILAVVLTNYFWRWITVFDFQRGLLYHKGKLKRVLEAGKYHIFKPWQSITIVDMRSFVATVANQEIITADHLALKLSSAVTVRVADPVKATQDTRNYLDALHLTMQLAMRELVSGLKIEEILTRRNELSAALLEKVKASAGACGLFVESGGIKDVTFTGDVKRIFSQVAQAEKSSQAALARARAEVASLRALANAARMMDENPHLLALRTLQSAQELAATPGNTIVLGLPSSMVPLHFGAPGTPAGKPGAKAPGNVQPQDSE